LDHSDPLGAIIMTLYFVLDTCAENHLLMLYDSFGMYHVAHTAAALPETGTELHGTAPCLGSHILHATATGQVFRVNFEVIDCGQQAAFDRLHGSSALAEDEPLSPWPRISAHHPHGRSARGST
jgi:hypothetical protein